MRKTLCRSVGAGLLAAALITGGNAGSAMAQDDVVVGSPAMAADDDEGFDDWGLLGLLGLLGLAGLTRRDHNDHRHTTTTTRAN